MFKNMRLPRDLTEWAFVLSIAALILMIPANIRFLRHKMTDGLRHLPVLLLQFPGSYYNVSDGLTRPLKTASSKRTGSVADSPPRSKPCLPPPCRSRRSEARNSDG